MINVTASKTCQLGSCEYPQVCCLKTNECCCKAFTGLEGEQCTEMTSQSYLLIGTFVLLVLYSFLVFLAHFSWWTKHIRVESWVQTSSAHTSKLGLSSLLSMVAFLVASGLMLFPGQSTHQGWRRYFVLFFLLTFSTLYSSTIYSIARTWNKQANLVLFQSTPLRITAGLLPIVLFLAFVLTFQDGVRILGGLILLIVNFGIMAVVLFAARKLLVSIERKHRHGQMISLVSEIRNIVANTARRIAVLHFFAGVNAMVMVFIGYVQHLSKGRGAAPLRVVNVVTQAICIVALVCDIDIILATCRDFTLLPRQNVKLDDGTIESKEVGEGKGKTMFTILGVEVKIFPAEDSQANLPVTS